MSLKKIRLLVYLTVGLDPLNPDDSTYVDINVAPDEMLSKVHEVISTLLFLDSDEEYLYHREKETLITNKITSTSTSTSTSSSSPEKDDTDQALNPNKTLKELGILNGETLFLELKPKDKRKRKRDLRAFKDEVDEDGIMQITCTTKLLNSDGEPYRKLRVLVHKDHLSNYLMDDVSALWHKVALKFRVGRMVLSRDKTYRSLGIEDGAEVVVTGGRE
jgi:hypothetical protein